MAKKLVKLPDELTIGDCYARIDEIESEILNSKVERGQLGEALSEVDKRVSRLNSEKQQLEARAKSLREKPHVSDHALLRYLERKYDFDSDAIRAEILTPEVKSAIKVGASGVKSHGGTFKINGTTIVTFIHPKKT